MQLIERPRISRRTRPANSDSREGVSQNSQSCEPALLSHVEILNIVVAPNLLSPIIRLAVRDSLVAALAKVGQSVGTATTCDFRHNCDGGIARHFSGGARYFLPLSKPESYHLPWNTRLGRRST